MAVAQVGKKGTLGRDPLTLAIVSKAQATAIRAIQEGVANAEQQKLALDWIIRAACRTYEPSYCNERTHDAAFIEGQRFAGNQIIAILTAKLGTFED
jgi:predicted YcjX-like family ATPase